MSVVWCSALCTELCRQTLSQEGRGYDDGGDDDDDCDDCDDDDDAFDHDDGDDDDEDDDNNGARRWRWCYLDCCW